MVANIAALAALASGTLLDGSLAFVQTYKAYFQLVASVQGAAGNVRVVAAGNAGRLWERVLESPDWAGAGTWVLDPANSTGLASDENSGATALLPLLTYSEHARRLTNATIATAVTVSVLSSQQAGDVPVYAVNVLPLSGSLTFTGKFTPIYTGQVTTYVAGAAAPSTDNGYTIIDNTIPVSFTASGLMADAVLFKRTNGTLAFWWAAKDMGGAAPAAQLRISVPVTATGRAAIALANGDTYQAGTVPQIISPMRFVNAQGQLINTVIFQQFDWNIIIERAPSNIEHINCFERAAFYSGTCFANSAFKGSNVFWPVTGDYPANNYFGLLRSGASLIVTGGAVTQWGGRLVCQNSTIHPNQASFQFAGDLAIYDLVSGSGLVADYWSVILFQAGAICGNNNAGNAVVWANKWSQITFLAASLSAAGTFTSGTPYQVGGTNFSPAQIDAGTANQMTTKGNGIYPTD